MISKLFRLPWRTEARIAREVEAELRFHMEERTARLMATGLSRSDAETKARAEFGDIDDAKKYMNRVDRVAETHRRRKDFMGDFIQDVVYAVRKLRSAPVFAITVILTLSVGIGATVTVLNLVSATMLRPPDVARPGELAWVTPLSKSGRFAQWAYPQFASFRRDAKSWTGLIATGGMGLTLGDRSPVRMNGDAVSGNYFEMLGVRPQQGRGFLAYEDSLGTDALAIVFSHRFWRTHFNGDSSIVGKTIPVNSRAVTVVGIGPEGFNGLRLGEDTDFWIPIGALTSLSSGSRNLDIERGSHWLRVVGRLRDGTTLADAQAEASFLESRIYLKEDADDIKRPLNVTRVRGGLPPSNRAEVAPVLMLTLLVPLLVLGVACANVANLFVSRSVQRQKELAVRRALGATRGRLVRQLLTECVILGLAAGIVGVAISYAMTGVIGRTADLPQDIVRILVPDARVFVITFVIAILSGATFGLLPALAVTRKAITPALKSDGIAMQVGRGRHRLRDAFVVSQMAMSLTLLITAGLFVGSLQKALSVEPGFDTSGLVSATYDLSGQGYPRARIVAFAEELARRMAARPGVEGAAVADVLPLSSNSSATNVGREGEPRERDVFSYDASVTPGYFAAMRIPIVKGRGFDARDAQGAPLVTVVNERLAAQLWPGEEPLGKRLSVGGNPKPYEVIGVVRNGKYRSLAEATDERFFYTADAQNPISTHGMVVVRGTGGAVEAIATMRAVLSEMDASLPITAVGTVDAAIAKTVDGQRAGAALLGIFGIIGLALAAFGIFGVIAQGVAARTREIGIRMSLGARAADVVRAFVREGLSLTLIGAIVGVGISLGLSKVLSSLLFGLKATDLLTFAGATLALIAMAAVASFLPARRAAKVDPLIALRSD